MRISALLERPLVLLGAAREGQATLALLRARGHRGSVHVTGDHPPATSLDDAPFVPGDRLQEVLQATSVVVRSPGFAPHHPLRARIDASGCAQTTATRLALAELRAAGLPVIGVTASKGKSTISTLVWRLLQAAGVKTELAGNIGIPVLARLDKLLAERATVVMELSSYQCDDLQAGEGAPQVVFGRLFPEHLDWHGSLRAYYAAKARLLSAAPPGAWLHVDARSMPVLQEQGLGAALARADSTCEAVNDPAGLHVAAGRLRDGRRDLMDAGIMRVPGLHNRENACLAFAAARPHGCTAQHLAQVLASFEGLPFRLQDEGSHAGIRWINDSISTAPEAACAGLEALQGQVATLIAGGQDRGYDYLPLAHALRQWQVGTLVALPESGPAIQAATTNAAGSGPHALRIVQAADLPEAVRLAAALTPPGRTCLFSPAAPSYHAWPGFEARGAEFRQLVAQLDRQ